METGSAEKRKKEKEKKEMTFSEKVYQLTRLIPKGKVVTYGQIAKKMANPKSARATGNALHKNPDPKIIPCHRVVNRHGRLAPGFGNGGWQKQRKKLLAEKVKFKDQHHVDLVKCQWKF
ncbi:MAG TPA: MGMT family protein [Candidatus Bathyarchaeia archaeon]|nr:MGMT family protein [Candidatus Bathyarchaeia archaeon]